MAMLEADRPVLASFLVSVLLLTQLVESDLQVIRTVEEDNLILEKIDCDAACESRCQLSSRPHLCMRACGTCCARCDCVPPGTYGNYDACPCYANMTTHEGRHKCP
ncbi:gibberellin-regulated protein 1-like [Carica papaya]|uniref:gibberellin-regulated protein 1-like n=1 Tax=Carica papaya TaxID=3649 RepID=UPI000B8D114A|nr:gibberellin-regulated protein 1-like [Carica papaya]